MQNWYLPGYFCLPFKEASYLFRDQFLNSALVCKLLLLHPTAPSFSNQSSYEGMVPGVFPSAVLPAETYTPSCSFMHSSSWARALGYGYKDVPCLLWLQLMAPWFFSNSFWASYCLTPKSQNCTVLSCSNLDWTTYICFYKGKSTHYTYIIFNSVYRCIDYIKIHRHIYTLSLLICLFGLSSSLLEEDGFFFL